ncbi:MAG: CDP-alcohol phosphatidyltransferase family protein [Planctomycetota bacterium]|nr:CDP-alcohol phosphatidyltransferase family protein [Planctomycetota bacterium]
MADGEREYRWIKPVPNILTVLRIVAAGILPFGPVAWRLALVLFAGISDWLDGWIARRFHAQSKLGALLDGVADKLFVLSAVVTFVGSGDLPLWQGLVLMARDITVGLIAGYAVLTRQWHAFGHMEARLAGKLTTAFVLPWFATLLIPAVEPARTPLFILAAIASVAAAIDYLIQLRTKVRQVRDAEADPAG